MADKVVDVASNGSPERVGYDLFSDLRHALPRAEGLDYIDSQLRLYKACRAAARGVGWDKGKLG